MPGSGPHMYERHSQTAMERSRRDCSSWQTTAAQKWHALPEREYPAVLDAERQKTERKGEETPGAEGQVRVRTLPSRCLEEPLDRSEVPDCLFAIVTD